VEEKAYFGSASTLGRLVNSGSSYVPHLLLPRAFDEGGGGRRGRGSLPARYKTQANPALLHCYVCTLFKRSQ
jgi:hypothetical protein